MAPKRSDRLSSSLLHVFRVTHAARDAKAVSPRVRADGKVALLRADLRRTTLSEAALVETVRVDLIALLNTVHLDSAQPLDDAPNVRRSILNYGFPDLLSRTMGANNTRDIGGDIERVLTRHEPRLDPASIRIEREVTDDRAAIPTLRFFVSANVRAYPIDLPLEFIAEVDEPAGKLRVRPR